MDKIVELRKQLHEIPEVSGHEVKTMEMLINFLRDNTSLEIVEKEGWFYAVHREAQAVKNMAFRADMDAVTVTDEVTCEQFAAHRCGHDGHSSALCAFALMLEGKHFGKNLFLLFQPAEETGEGAAKCKELLRECRIDEIYGVHNIPGYPLHSVLICPDIFACASMGLSITMVGAETHAAYPEAGRNPAPALAKLVLAVQDCLPAAGEDRGYKGLVLATIVGGTLGSRSFGVAAGSGDLHLTIRAHYDEDLKLLKSRIEEHAKDLADKYGLTCSVNVSDVFPDTRNHAGCVKRVLSAAEESGLSVLWPEEPFRWSEDFGHYLKEVPGAFIGIGAGEDHPQLHTAEYEYPDEILLTTARLFYALGV